MVCTQLAGEGGEEVDKLPWRMKLPLSDTKKTSKEPQEEAAEEETDEPPTLTLESFMTDITGM